MSFIARQPNGLLCRHSSITDCITDYNMTDEEYVNLCIEKAIEQAKHEAEEVLKDYVRDMDLVKASFLQNNMSKKRFNEILKEMEKPACECKHMTT
ncbi:hypothetical protein [Lachnoclostridium phytofermentans]|uniref:hypothetical protein n=1 Tax=Lachnoclostridium phytofermentans TaxID=66219 RepID=UPI000497B6F7|nr:hypothetical protein [Lachnoclostridium phytofermentans]